MIFLVCDKCFNIELFFICIFNNICVLVDFVLKKKKDCRFRNFESFFFF